MKKLASLFWEFFKLALFVIGGGYAILAVAEDVFSRKGWTKEGELLDRLPVFQMIPGIVAGHTAVYVGNRVAGVAGSLVAVLAVALPSVVIFTLVSQVYTALPLDNPRLLSAFVGLRAALTGILAATIARGAKRILDPFSLSVCALALAALAIGRIPVWIVLLAAMCAGIAAQFAPRVSDGRRFRSPGWLGALLFVKYGLLCFGGGYVLVPMYLEDFVGAAAPYLQIAEDEFADIIALTQMTPGPIGVNGATFFGYRFAGVPGAIVASVALLLPGSVLGFLAFRSLDRFRASRIVCGLLRGVRPASVALMLVALWSFARMCVLAGADFEFNPTAAILVAVTAAVLMKKKMKVVPLIVLCALAAAAVKAEESVTSERYPDADTVVVDDRTDIVYQEDGTFVLLSETSEKALTERGRRTLSTFSTDYSRRYGTAEIVSVEIVGADGAVRAVDFARTLREATDNSSTAANIYDPLDRTLSCGVPGIAVGETRRIVVRKTVTKSRVKDQWADIELLESTDPVVRARVRIDGPLARPLRSVALRHPLGNVSSSVVTNRDRIVWTWEAKDSPQMFPEPSMPPVWTAGQHLLVSTARDWREISRWYWDVSRLHLEKTTAAMTNTVNEIVRRNESANGSRDDLMRAIYTFVSQEIRYMGLTLEDTSPGYAPHDVDVTFDNRYGVCRDKAALLVALLRIAGFDAYPVLISAGPAKMDPEVPLPYFNHAIVAVASANPASSDGAYVLMDPTDESSRDLCPSYLSDCSYLVARPEGEDLRTSPTVPPERNAVSVEGKGRLSKDGSMLVDYSLAFRGLNDNLYRHHLLTCRPEDRRKFFEALARRAASGAELLRCEIRPADLRDTTRELDATLLVRYPETLLRGETRDELSVPSLSAELGAANWLLEGRTALETRKYPLRLSSTASTSERVTVDLGGAVGATAHLPETERLEGGYAFARSFVRTGETLVFSRTLSVGALEFSSEGYLDLRERIKRAEASGRDRPSFAKNRLANANVRVLSRVTSYDLSGDSSWVSTNGVVQEILTYEGKKGAAELVFPFNPTWQTVEVVSAVVSNRDGTVVRAGERETNVLDADWVASAPRYPASKRLVVNLPSVEIGSVVSYTVVTAVTNAPVPFCRDFLFDVSEPTDFLSVRVNGWTREVRNPKLLADERHLPPSVLWRDAVSVSSNSFATAARDYRALDPEPLDPRGVLGEEEPTVRAIRDWMARHVRIAGPGFGEIRLADHVVPPETVVRERYATRIGYVRTLCALLRGAGFGADVVFAGDTAEASDELVRRAKEEFPNVRFFPYALCRVRERTGGFLFWGGETKTLFIGTENEYAPLGASAFEGSLFLDPQTESFGVVTAPEADLATREDEMLDFAVRENGSVDLDYRLERRGATVGASRKRYAEMLPEIRSRHFQQLLGSIAQAATATRELETDVGGYPFALTFSAFIPDLAVVTEDAISIEVPGIGTTPFDLEGTVRENPVGVGGEKDVETTVARVSFPEGWTEIEHLPEPFVFRNPSDPSEKWFALSVAPIVSNGVLTVEVRSERFARRAVRLPAESAALLREWSRRAGSKANATVVVRRPSALTR